MSNFNRFIGTIEYRHIRTLETTHLVCSLKNLNATAFWGANLAMTSRFGKMGRKAWDAKVSYVRRKALPNPQLPERKKMINKSVTSLQQCCSVLTFWFLVCVCFIKNYFNSNAQERYERVVRWTKVYKWHKSGGWWFDKREVRELWQGEAGGSAMGWLWLPVGEGALCE